MLPGTSVGFPFFMFGGLALQCCRDIHMGNPRNTKNMSGLHSKCGGSPLSHAYPRTGNIFLFGIPHRNRRPSGLTIPRTLQGCWQGNTRPPAHVHVLSFVILITYWAVHHVNNNMLSSADHTPDNASDNNPLDII